MTQVLRYPVLEIDLEKVQSNARNIVDQCSEMNICVTGIVKGFNAYSQVAEQMVLGGCDSLGSSRLDQLIKLKEAGLVVPLMLLRLPMLTEVEDVIEHVDMSLVSEKVILEALNQRALETQKTHKVILMYDLGDLREGIWDERAFVKLASFVENKLQAIELYGIGTNLGCYGSIRPTPKNMQKLVQVAELIEDEIHRKLEVISGGATTSFPLVMSREMPARINHLRIGEGILLSRDFKSFFGYDMSHLYSDTFVLKAEIVEIQEKPSYPVGDLFVDAFGNKPQYEDKGIQKRALLAVGKQDFGDHEKLIPVNPEIEIIGSSSDHLIVDITHSDAPYQVGEHLAFILYYQAMLYLSLSEDVLKIFK